MITDRGPQARPGSHLELLTFAAAVITIILWGSAYIGVVIALKDFGPGELAVLRFLVASATLLVMSSVARIRVPDRRDWWPLFRVGLLGITTYHLLLNFGAQSVPPAVIALILQIAPVFTTFLASRFLGETVSRRSMVGTGIALVGASLLVLGRGGDLEFQLGAMLIVACAFATSCYFVFQQPLTRKYGPRTVTTWTMVMGTLPLLVFLPSALGQLHAASTRSLLAVLYIGVFPAGIAYTLWNFVIHRVGATRSTIYLFFTPAVTALAAWWMLDQVPSRLSIIGGLVVILGVLFVTDRRRVPRHQTTPSAEPDPP